jgi:hypothetical protein
LRTLALLLIAVIGTLAAEARAGHISFLVAERPGLAVHSDSFVLTLDDPAAIAHARALIARGPDIGGAIVMAKIAAGADGVNRDYLATGAPAWSWHITDFVGFVDQSAELYDGYPTFVERDVPGWIANTGGMIGFWGYTVVAELSAVPEPGSLTLLASGALVLLGYGARRGRRWTTSRKGFAKAPLNY